MESSASVEVFTTSGTICPADPRGKKSERKKQTNWNYYNGTDWIDGDFDLMDNCHPVEH